MFFNSQMQNHFCPLPEAKLRQGNVRHFTLMMTITVTSGISVRPCTVCRVSSVSFPGSLTLTMCQVSWGMLGCWRPSTSGRRVSPYEYITPTSLRGTADTHRELWAIWPKENITILFHHNHIAISDVLWRLEQFLDAFMFVFCLKLSVCPPLITSLL